MYQAEYLSTFPYFRQTMENVSLASLHDALTGTIARRYMLEFVHDLIRRGVPFTLAMIDLDNFKSINDHYGHATGDELLIQVGENLREMVGRDGLAGRFGGDEFLTVYLKCNEYDHIHAFYDTFYWSGRLFRRDYTVSGHTLYITATLGSAAFPQDAGDYDGLFALVDKTLYRGKSKGRNCFIIYVAAKHAHLEIPTLARHSLFETLRLTAEGYREGADAEDRLRRGFQPIRENLRMSALLFIRPDGSLRDVTAGREQGAVGGVDALMENGVYAATDLKACEQMNPALAAALTEAGFESALFFRVEGRGCLVFCPEAHTLHIWQDEERSAAFFLAWLAANEK